MKAVGNDEPRTRKQKRRSEGLLERYHRTRALSVRNKLIERYHGIVENMARALSLRLPRSVDVGDLEHAGMWGLMQALENYRPERGCHFLGFMRLRVRGAMLDELRNLDFMPRLHRRRMRLREEATRRLRQDLNRDPSDEEIAEALGVSVSRFRREYHGPSPLRLVGGTEPEDEDALESVADDGLEAPIDALQRQEMLEKIKDNLQPIEWKVLRMHYLEGMSGKDIARRLRLSASRICQIHGRVMERLKLRLAR